MDLPGRRDAASQPEVSFVVLEHADAQGIHYDLMIDAGDALATWKCSLPPENAAAAPLSCRRIADHRRKYLDYEGSISGDRGRVRRHDQGVCTVHAREPGGWRVAFQGRRLAGLFDLVSTGQGDDQWRLCSLDS